MTAKMMLALHPLDQPERGEQSMCLSDPRLWSTVGLLLDIVGTLLFAVPVFVDAARLRREGFSTEQTVFDRIKESNYAKAGIVFLGMGFVFQLVGAWMK
jgi:hypothetical protein